MIHDLQPYPAYKDSGVPWLGEVPEHWEVVPNRALFAEVKEREHPDEQMLSVTITQGVIRQRTLLEGSSKKDSSNQDKSAYKLVCLGDIAYNKMRAWQGAIGVSDFRGIISPAYVVVRLRDDNDPRYFHHLLRTPQFAKEAERWSYGITSDMWSLRPEHFRMIYSSLPSGDEQAAIVRFLDHVDRRIRRYIRAKQKLIKLLEEQKQAIVHGAVTRGLPAEAAVKAGLDPNVRLKPSGVEWLGDVPEHWNLERARWLFRKMDRPIRETDEVVTCFRDGVVTLRKNRRVRGFTESLKEIGYQGIRRGDLVIHAMDAFAGAVGVADADGKGTPVYSVCEPGPSANAHFYAITIREMARSQWILALAKGIRERSTDFRFDDFGSQRVPLPPLPEQAAIVRFLDDATANIVATIDRAHREISLLREYRTRLIADVVTGKLDVRKAAAHLPDEAETPEPLDDSEVLAEGEESTGSDLDAVPEEAKS